MARKKEQGKTLWDPSDTPPVVDEYLDSYGSEFSEVDFISSYYPYSGCTSKYFKKVPSGELVVNLKDETKPQWKLKFDRVANPVTADLLVAAERLGAEMESDHGGSSFRWMGGSQGRALPGEREGRD